MAYTGRLSRVARVRSGASHHSTLVTRWHVRVTGIEFIDDYPMEAGGRNRSNTDPDRQHYPAVPEDFGGWGRGMPLTGWDWEGTDNLERAVCYRRQREIHMRVRLQSPVPAPTYRTFTLRVTPTLDGSTTVLTQSEVSVSWPSRSQEQIVPLIAPIGSLPDEVSRYHLRLTWLVTGHVPHGTTESNHKIFSTYEAPLDPDVSSASGSAQAPITGLTKQRLDKLTLVIGGRRQRCPTASSSDVDRLIWILCQTVNDSGPPHFDGQRAQWVQYGNFGDTAPYVELVDQWVMWLEGRRVPVVPGGQNKPWNVGACISYAQLMKTMLASVGINSRLAWVIPRTNLLPNGSTAAVAANNVVITDTFSDSLLQTTTIHYSGLDYTVSPKLIDNPLADGTPSYENFEACLFYGGKLVPGAIATNRYPRSVLAGQVGFPDALAVLRWWHSVSHGTFHRFMAWVSESPRAFFDRDGTYYSNPYNIPVAKWLPVP